MNDISSEFFDFMCSSGVEPHSSRTPIADGRIHRFRVSGDKSGSKNGWYVLYADGVAAGACGSWKTGVRSDWRANGTNELSDLEREKINDSVREAQKVRESERAQQAELARTKANKIWSEAESNVNGHKYLETKGVAAHGLKITDDRLWIPLRTTSGDICNLQAVTPNGRKLFLSDGRVKGLYHSIGKPNGTIVICEGYSTGATIYESTSLAVAVAFNANNLAPVAEAIRQKYPQAQIIVAADDDRNTEGNPGITKATETANKVSGQVAIPKFKDTSSNPTDFNDLASLEGSGAVRAVFAELLSESNNVVSIASVKSRQDLEKAINATEDFDELTVTLAGSVASSGLSNAAIAKLQKDIAKKAGISVSDIRKDSKLSVSESNPTSWKDMLMTEDNGTPYAIPANVALVLEHDKSWAGVLGYDSFALRPVKLKLPPFSVASTGEWSDLDDAKTAMWLAAKYNLRATSSVVAEGVSVAADKASFHPLQDYLTGLKWDGVRRLPRFPSVYLGAEDTPYTRLVGRCWMIAAAARAMEPGCKMDNVLILEGKQGTNKSSAFEVLAGKWFAESISELGSKDSYMCMQGKWIIELGEMDTFKRAESSRAKSFFAARSDTYRPPYGKRPITVPRSCVYAGSENSGQYLKDETGNRRYWPICGVTVNLDMLSRDRDQLWAEALHEYQAGEQWWIPADLDYVQDEQEQRCMADSWEPLIASWLRIKGGSVTTGEIMGDCLEIPTGQWTRLDQMRVGSILRRLGYERRRAMENGERTYLYFKVG